jgi:cytochrome b561
MTWDMRRSNNWPINSNFFSMHKTVGVTIFHFALARIIWAKSRHKPNGLHPEGKAETWLAETIHWVLYSSLVMPHSPVGFAMLQQRYQRVQVGVFRRARPPQATGALVSPNAPISPKLNSRAYLPKKCVRKVLIAIRTLGSSVI